MEKEWALEVKNLSKSFFSNQRVRALDDVSFILKKGDILGLIGDNGAGKSTLLKIISGLIKPEKGTVTYRGKLSSILDIGSGFHPDLSGIDNIFLWGRINGISDKVIKDKLEDIISFSGLKNFIDTPLKYYSSGMFLRLAFSTTTSFHTDIMLLDEIMSVGDIAFQQKSKDKIREIVRTGSTVIIAGHNIEELNNICTHGLWLSLGKQVMFGGIREVIEMYLRNKAFVSVGENLVIDNIPHQKPEKLHAYTSQKSGDIEKESDTNKILVPDTDFIQHVVNKEDGNSNEDVVLLEAGIRSKGKPFTDMLYMEDELEITLRYKKNSSLPLILFTVVHDKFGQNIMSMCSHRTLDKTRFLDNSKPGVYKHTINIPIGFFNNVIYTVSFIFTNAEEQVMGDFNKILYFKVYKSAYRFDIFSFKGDFPGDFIPYFDCYTVLENAQTVKP